MRIDKRTHARLKRAKTISAGGTLADSTVTLCLYSPNIDIPNLTAILGCDPTYSQVKGQLRRPPHGRGPAKLGLWFLEAPKQLGFEEKIRHLLDATPASPATWRRVAKTHNVQLRCGIFMHSFNEGFDLPTSMTAEMGKRQWSFLVDIYGAEGEEVLEAFLSPAKDRRIASKLAAQQRRP